MRSVVLLLVASTFLVNAGELVFLKGLACAVPGRVERRAAFPVDEVAKMVVAGKWTPPTAGQALVPGDTDRTWQTATAAADGTFTTRERGAEYIDCQMESDAEQVWLLSAAGQEIVYVNGEPRPGDPYSNGILELPVRLQRGANDFLFRVNRGRLKAKLTLPRKPITIYLGDTTLPDIVRGEKENQWGAVVIVNCTTNLLKGLTLQATVDGHGELASKLPSVPPLSVRKAGFLFQPRWNEHTNQAVLNLKLTGPRHEPLDTATLKVPRRLPTEHYQQTFLSDIDGSVQYYAVAPAQPSPADPPPQALFLSLHGAGVEASGQAGAYRSKTWGTVVAPTNRRYYGFDWEDWGRKDALEVLRLATNKFKPDPKQIYLTGHSMGGHGTWNLGITYPDLFAAIAPSAGWISFRSYGGSDSWTNGDSVQQILQRAGNPCDTLALITNCLHFGVYVLHGDQDDNVPVTEARTMRNHLALFQSDFMYHEQPGAGHWWGNQCVDWPPIFDLFARHKIPSDQEVCDLNFSTMNPGISSSSHWISILQQRHALEKSVVAAKFDPAQSTFNITTENVAMLSLRPSQIAPVGPVHVTLDGQTLGTINGPQTFFARQGESWSVSEAPSEKMKGPNRYGPFKEAFGCRMIFVYATHGTPEENAWAVAKSRLDAEAWWYRGNGAVDVVPDAEFDVAKEPNRGVVLYGNAANNSAWSALLGDSPVQVQRGNVTVGTHSYASTELACLFCRPRPGSDHACVAVVSGTGIVGLRLTDRIPYLTAGVAYPDCTVFGLDTLSKGTAGVRAAGFFGNDWGVDSGDFAWRE